MQTKDAQVAAEVDRLLGSCMILGVGELLRAQARRVASAAVRTLDAIQLATALQIGADQLLAYDRRLLAAAARSGLACACPGRTQDASKR